jgi:serine/threonine-protein kinase RsbW
MSPDRLQPDLRSDDLRLEMEVTDAPDLRLLLPNRADNVALVRQALSGVGELLELDEALVNDIKTAVSEACNNVVLHAYDGEEGPLEVYVCPDETRLDIVVSDRGSGIKPRPPEPEAGVQGVGLSLIQALTDRVEFSGAAGEGTEVKMEFHADREVQVASASSDPESDSDAAPPKGETLVSVTAGELAAPVLSRVAGTLAARAGFSVERLSETQLVTDAVAAHSPDAIVGPRVNVAFDVDDGALALAVGPLRDGGGERMVRSSALAGMDPLLERLCDEVEVRRDGHEQLFLRLQHQPD